MIYETPIIKTERINFVRLSEKLVQEYLSMVNDVEVQKYISRDIKKIHSRARIGMDKK